MGLKRPERAGNQGIPESVDVAAAIIEEAGPLDQMKLQKLLYYAQAWYLAWYDEPMFNDVVEAWKYGPAIPSIHQVYGGEEGYKRRLIHVPEAGDPAVLGERRRAALAAVIQAYGDVDGPSLATLSKSERPWPEARGDKAADEPSHRPISRNAMKRYYRREGKFGPPEAETNDRKAAHLRAVIESLGLEEARAE